MDETDTGYSDLELASTHTMAQCLPNVRWIPRSSFQAADYRLQQAWSVTHRKAGIVIEYKIEWRDVPIENKP